MATKSVSLNEAERHQELAQAKARHEEREREERTLRATRPVTYEITLENASSPGLPPPVAYDTHGSSTTGSSTETDDPDEASPGRSSSGDIIPNESERILADYVDLLGGQRTQGSVGTT